MVEVVKGTLASPTDAVGKERSISGVHLDCGSSPWTLSQTQDGQVTEGELCVESVKPLEDPAPGPGPLPTHVVTARAGDVL